jgi:DNA-binding LacI/PurR family transcriptional regulator
MAPGALVPSRRRGEAKAVDALLRLLETGAFPPGSRLPPERELCERCGVSRMTLRRALERMAVMGRVEPRRGSGTFVTRPSPQGAHPDIAIMYTVKDAALDGLIRHAQAAGCGVRIHWQPDFQWQPAAERRFLREVRNRRLRGLLAFCTPIEPHSNALLRDLEQCGVRVLHIEHYRLTVPDQPYLLPDFRRAGHMATVRLLIAGYRHLYYVGYPRDGIPFERLLIEGFAAALREHRPDLDPAAALLEFPQAEDGVDSAASYECKLIDVWRRLPPDSGLVVHNAAHAARLVAVAPRVGVAIPERNGIIGIDVAGGRGETLPPIQADALSFDRPALYDRALACLLADPWNPPRELVMPAYLGRGTVRPAARGR